MRFSVTVFSVVPLPSISTPSLRLPEMNDFVIALSCVPAATSTPFSFGRAAVAVASVPTSSFASVVRVVAASPMETADSPLPEMRFPSTEPSRVSCAPSRMVTPSLLLGSADAPDASVPTALLSMSTPAVPAPATVIPDPPLAEIRLPPGAPTVGTGPSPMAAPLAPAATRTPSASLGMATVPCASVPMRLPLTWAAAAPVPVISTPCPALPEITFRPAVVPSPTVLLAALKNSPSMSTPSPPLGTAALPPELVPMKLPCTERSSEVLRTPPSRLPEMTLRAAATVPPIVVPGAEITSTPRTLPSAAPPPGVVPMKLPATRFPWPPEITTPLSPLPETRLRTPLVVPPIAFSWVPTPATTTPSPVLGTALPPPAEVPMKLPSTVLCRVSKLLPSVTPLPTLPPMTLRAAADVPPIRRVALPPSTWIPRAAVGQCGGAGAIEADLVAGDQVAGRRQSADLDARTVVAGDDVAIGRRGAADRVRRRRADVDPRGRRPRACARVERAGRVRTDEVARDHRPARGLDADPGSRHPVDDQPADGRGGPDGERVDQREARDLRRQLDGQHGVVARRERVGARAGLGVAVDGDRARDGRQDRVQRDRVNHGPAMSNWN